MYGPITVREVLNTKGFGGSRVAAGHTGLEREVKTITVAEVPDAMDWLRGGELVVTTAYYIKENPLMADRWVKGLIDNGAVALAIKPARFIGTIPENILSIGNNLAFPIIELPATVTWPLLIESVANLILDRQTAILKDSEEIHNRLTRLVIESKGLQAIADTIASLLQNSILIEDQWFRTLAVAVFRMDDADYIKIRTSAEYLDVLKEMPAIKALPGEHGSRYLLLETPQVPLQQVVFPITVENSVVGYLSVLTKQGLTERDYKVLEHGATVVALELVKQRAMFEAKERLRLDTMRTLLEYTETNEREMKSKASLVGFDLEGPVLTAIFKWDFGSKIRNEKNVFVGLGVEQSLAKMIRADLERLDPRAFVVTRPEDIVAFLHPNKKAAEPDVYMAKRIKKIIDAFYEQYPGVSLNAGVGKAYKKVKDYRRSYEEAQLSIKAGQTFKIAPVVAFSELGYYRLASLVQDRNELEKYYGDVLKDLVNPDRENQLLLKTLEVFLACNGNRAQVARQLYLHVNTVNYRLAKIEELLKIDLDRAEVRVNLYLALSLYRTFMR